jgi:hypothetical protein
VDESDEEEEDELTKDGKAMKKLIRNLEKNNAYDSDEERNPYASSVSLLIVIYRRSPHIFGRRKRRRRRRNHLRLQMNPRYNPSLHNLRLGLAPKRHLRRPLNPSSRPPLALVLLLL